MFSRAQLFSCPLSFCFTAVVWRMLCRGRRSPAPRLALFRILLSLLGTRRLRVVHVLQVPVVSAHAVVDVSVECAAVPIHKRHQLVHRTVPGDPASVAQNVVFCLLVCEIFGRRGNLLVFWFVLNSLKEYLNSKFVMAVCNSGSMHVQPCRIEFETMLAGCASVSDPPLSLRST